jgi:hypothetical protein
MSHNSQLSQSFQDSLTVYRTNTPLDRRKEYKMSTIEDFDYLLEVGNAEASTSFPMAAGQLKKGGSVKFFFFLSSSDSFRSLLQLHCLGGTPMQGKEYKFHH